MPCQPDCAGLHGTHGRELLVCMVHGLCGYRWLPQSPTPPRAPLPTGSHGSQQRKPEGWGLRVGAWGGPPRCRLARTPTGWRGRGRGRGWGETWYHAAYQGGSMPVWPVVASEVVSYAPPSLLIAALARRVCVPSHRCTCVVCMRRVRVYHSAYAADTHYTHGYWTLPMGTCVVCMRWCGA